MNNSLHVLLFQTFYKLGYHELIAKGHNVLGDAIPITLAKASRNIASDVSIYICSLALSVCVTLQELSKLGLGILVFCAYDSNGVYSCTLPFLPQKMGLPCVTVPVHSVCLSL